MSGMSNGAFADITSMRSTEERVVHLNNILKFAVFKKDRSLLAIGGPWNAALDGGDPLADCSCLIRTAISRYVKELVQVDLSNCTSWNRFLEVHYNRVGNDGLFSHKEITVLFVPNLSECVPSMDIWRNNWIAYRKSKIEREQLIMKEKSPGDPKEQKQVLEEPNEAKSTNDQLKEGDGAAKIEKIDADMELKEGDGAAKIEKIDAEMELKEGDGATKIEKIDADMEEQGKDGDVNLAGDGGKNHDNVGEQVEKIVGVVEENTSGDASVDHVTEDKKPMRKKIIKKVVKVVRKKPTAEAPVDKSPQVDKNAVAETASKTVQKHIEQKSEDLGKEKAGAGIVQQPEAKKTGKKKVIRRIVKRKVPASATEPTALAAPAEASKQDVDVQTEKIAEGVTDAGNSQTKLEEGLKIPAEDISNQKKEEGLKTPAEDTSNQKKEQELEIKGDIMTDDQKANTDNVNQQEVIEQKDPKIDETNEKSDQKKDDNETKDKDQKMDSKKKSPIDTKEKKKSDEPPKHPGFILQAKKSKGYKLRSTSLSLDGLLDYTANDTEESVFELSLFAESFSEMLQYRMGCVILSFLEKLYRQYVVRRNQRKRQREEDLKKEDTISLEKRLKTTDENVTGSTSGNPGKNDETIKEGGEKIIGDNSSASHEQLVKEDDEKMSTDHAAQDEMMKEGEEKIDADQSAAAHDEPKADEKMEEEDPEYEEDPDEVEYEGDEDMDDATAEEPAEAQNEDNSNERETKPEEVTAEDDGKRTTENLKLEKTEEDKQSVAEKGDLKEVEEKSVGKEGKISGSQKGDSAKHDVVDKDLLQAFRYFDQNRVGYIKGG
uniref:DBC1/CARP1 catalytically inactive NUDIX hydrolase domain-containing protein n=3 Tax=Aegilops tauschii subsp. strangulata TaxID=200361 RepID=A0A453SDM1_AEGTS